MVWPLLAPLLGAFGAAAAPAAAGAAAAGAAGAGITGAAAGSLAPALTMGSAGMGAGIPGATSGISAMTASAPNFFDFNSGMSLGGEMSSPGIFDGMNANDALSDPTVNIPGEPAVEDTTSPLAPDNHAPGQMSGQRYQDVSNAGMGLAQMRAMNQRGQPQYQDFLGGGSGYQGLPYGLLGR